MKYHILYCLGDPVSNKCMYSYNNLYIDLKKKILPNLNSIEVRLLFANAIRTVVCTKQNSTGFNENINEFI